MYEVCSDDQRGGEDEDIGGGPEFATGFDDLLRGKGVADAEFGGRKTFFGGGRGDESDEQQKDPDYLGAKSAKHALLGPCPIGHGTREGIDCETAAGGRHHEPFTRGGMY